MAKKITKSEKNYGGLVYTFDDGSMQFISARGAIADFDAWAAQKTRAVDSLASVMEYVEKICKHVPKPYVRVCNGGNLGGNVVAEGTMFGNIIKVSGYKGGSFDSAVALHEYLHLCGWKHNDTVSPHETVMNTYVGNTSWGSFRIRDVNGLLDRYGANASYLSDNTTWSWEGRVPGSQRLGWYQVLVDGGGIDTLDFSGTDKRHSIDLRPSSGSNIYWSSVMGKKNDFVISKTTLIENAIGGDGDDYIRGNHAANVLTGGRGNDMLCGDDGNDTLAGGAGADTLDGWNGIDAADYRSSSAGVTVNLSSSGPQTGGDAAGDILMHIEGVLGSSSGDLLTGNTLDNQLYGGAGNDTLEGGKGRDFLYGGAGADKLYGGDDDGNEWDHADYSQSTAGVTVNLALTAPQTGGDAAGDELRSIELLTGSNHADLLKGTNGINILNGGAGADSLYGEAGNDSLAGGAGADKIFGGDGTDTADYSSSSAGVTVDLTAHSQAGGDAAGDVFNSIEAVSGSRFADSLVGGAGNDTLAGLGGNDVLVGGAGADSMDGGDGTDTVDYRKSSAGVTVDLSSSRGQTGGDAAGDVLRSFERLVGSNYADLLAGTDEINVLDGGGGADSLSGGAGNDYLNGGAGADTIYGGDGNDGLAGGAGADSIIGGNGTDTADYSSSSAAVTVDLTARFQAGGDAAGDVFNSIEAVSGSRFDDRLVGTDLNDTLSGVGGNDILAGGNGDDRLDGGAGNDLLDGGGWADTFAFTGTFGNDTIANFEIGADKIDLRALGLTAGDLTITASRVASNGPAFSDAGLTYDIAVKELGTIRIADTSYFGGKPETPIVFSLADILLAGDRLDVFEGRFGTRTDDVLTGQGGQDALYGGAGSDTLGAGAGNDRLDGGAGNDLLDGGSWADTFVFGGRFGNDTIANFEVGADKIDLRALGLTDKDLKITGSNPAANGVALTYDIVVKDLGSIHIDHTSWFSGRPQTPSALTLADFVF